MQQEYPAVTGFGQHRIWFWPTQDDLYCGSR